MLTIPNQSTTEQGRSTNKDVQSLEEPLVPPRSTARSGVAKKIRLTNTAWQGPNDACGDAQLRVEQCNQTDFTCRHTLQNPCHKYYLLPGVLARSMLLVADQR